MPELDTIDDVLLALGDAGLEPFPAEAIAARARSEIERELDCQRELERDNQVHRAPVRRRRRRRPGLRVAVVVVALMAAGGGAYAALSGSSQLSAGIDCHPGATLAGGGTIVAVNGTPATEVCARLWAQGAMGSADTPPAPLHACVSPNGDGAINVLASNDSNVCERVGLKADPQAGASPDARRYARFQDALDGWLNSTGSGCVSDSTVRREVQRALAGAGLAGWRITTHGAYSTQKPCASVAIDSSARTVTIFPSPS